MGDFLLQSTERLHSLWGDFRRTIRDSVSTPVRNFIAERRPTFGKAIAKAPAMAESGSQIETIHVDEKGNPTKPNDFNNGTNSPNTVSGAQWMLLWTTAAYSPEHPTEDEQKSLKDFFHLFRDECPDRSYSKAVEQFGLPPIGTRRELMMWLCLAQNATRGFTVRCRYNALLQRWRHADGYM